MAYSVGPLKRVKVLYPYDAKLDDELTIKCGDEIEVSQDKWVSNNKWIEGIIIQNSQKTEVKPKYFFKPLTVKVQPVKPKELPPSKIREQLRQPSKGKSTTLQRSQWKFG